MRLWAPIIYQAPLYIPGIMSSYYILCSSETSQNMRLWRRHTSCSPESFLKSFLFVYLFLLVALWDMEDLLFPLTRDRTHASCIGSRVSTTGLQRKFPLHNFKTHNEERKPSAKITTHHGASLWVWTLSHHTICLSCIIYHNCHRTRFLCYWLTLVSCPDHEPQDGSEGDYPEPKIYFVGVS